MANEREASQPLRRRGERMREAVLAATLGLLASEGLEGTTVNAVARAAGVHETSLYRRWKTRENLIFDALTVHADETLPDTGDVRQDLALLFGALSRFLATPQGAALLRLGAAHEGDLVEQGLRPYWNSRLERGESTVRRGIGRGELAAETDPRLLVEAIASLFFARVLLTGEPLGEDLAGRMVDLVLDGARPRSYRK
ncbi:TetR/AcrR family transcriptional regulator [Streptomyces sp. NBC_01142]|uniref:TetR/AcrR family transcriptional regulator C-terminal ligand-binding domain-containing protein n=1 Tax=Streptomyces sp. NBC_01142 TaxID=2975865 RepID=UPI00224E16DF|nr:TetR/AcrR family transcriptional regulator C-terminal ligand-binding domain-containing protein [Streptomyces sp. NBC_01142]MCX4825259.1 TetR/AcrR family transcriptional regulator [Streptomyces sp. NBC_01142]